MYIAITYVFDIVCAYSTWLDLLFAIYNTCIKLLACFTGIHDVLGQVTFLDTEVSCYGNDDTCTSVTSTHTSPAPGSFFVNPCCFTFSDPTDAFSITALHDGYYSIPGGPCQSCMGKDCHNYF